MYGWLLNNKTMNINIKMFLNVKNMMIIVKNSIIFLKITIFS